MLISDHGGFFLPQYFSGHDETGSFRVQLNVSCQKPNVAKRVLKVAEFLIGQSFNGGRVDGPEREHRFFEDIIIKFSHHKLKKYTGLYKTLRNS